MASKKKTLEDYDQDMSSDIKHFQLWMLECEVNLMEAKVGTWNKEIKSIDKFIQRLKDFEEQVIKNKISELRDERDKAMRMLGLEKQNKAKRLKKGTK